MDLWIAKVVALILILSLTVFFGMLPLKLIGYLKKYEDRVDLTGSRRRWCEPRSIVSYLNCFSGGVFLGTCLIHLFPEVSEKYENVHKQAELTFEYPLDQLIIGAGFFLIMLIEHGAMSCHEWQERKDKENENRERDRLMNPETPVTRTSYSGIDSEPASAIPRHVAVERQLSSNSFSNNYECGNESPHHHHPGQTHEETVQIHAIRSLMLLIALSLHTAFEGLALGLESSEANVWTLFGAIAIHKSIISFTLGLQLADTFAQKTRTVQYVLAFAVVCPIGIAIGIGVASKSTSGLSYEITNLTLQGLATGTFLYVTFFEVLQKELGVEQHSIFKVLVIMLGFEVIAASNIIHD